MGVYGFLTTEPNGVVGPYHKKAMPVFLRTAEEADLWLRGPWSEARVLPRPLPDEDLRVIEPPPKREALALAFAMARPPNRGRRVAAS